MNSEQYRQMLVRDGDRRFREWHQSFLAYQQRFQQAMAAKRPITRPVAVQSVAPEPISTEQPEA